jgi:cytidylate kinase
LQTRFIVAIDGPAGAGKSTIARALAAALGFVYIDTGAMYRAVALRAVRASGDLSDEPAMAECARACSIKLLPDNRVLLDGEDVSGAIRTPEIAQAASKVSALAGVRRAMVSLQRQLAESNSVVMEGRDIGTVVFPDAQVKVFLDASPEVRSTRRVLELRQKGIEADAATIASEIRERDHRDSYRTEAPLTQAPGAIYVDTSAMTAEQVVAAILQLVHEKTGKDIES